MGQSAEEVRRDIEQTRAQMGYTIDEIRKYRGWDTIDKVKERLNPKLEIEGVLGTMFDGRTLHSREVMDRLVQAWGDKVFHTVIRRTVKFSDSTVAGEPITSYASASSGAEAYRQLAKEVALRCLDV